MRSVIPIVLIGLMPMLSFECAGAAAAQEQKAPPVVQSPKATIPTPEPAKTDPAKMAAPVRPAGGTVPGGAPVDDKSYVIGAQDMLFVLVWGNNQLSNQVLVRPDGKITVGLINEITAAGQTPEKLAQDIAARLKAGDFVKNPQVQVSVIQINSKKFYIQGEVNKPGDYNLVVPTRVLEALVNAGGFRDFANKKDIRILRGDKQYRFNYNKVIQGKNKDENIWLQPGDIIIVK